MAFLNEQKRKFDELRAALRPEALSKLKTSSNGGNTVLFVYPPHEEQLYVAEARVTFPAAGFIDISELLVSYIDSIGWKDFSVFYDDYKNDLHRVFNTKEEGSNDLFSRILQSVESIYSQGQIPFLIRTGALFGTGIDNVNIMEHQIIMGAKTPLVIFYPAILENDTLLFLNARPASKYRCQIID